MDFAELVKAGAGPTDIQQYLAGGRTTAITVRIPQNLRDAAKEAAAMRGMGYSAFVRMCMIEQLSNWNGAAGLNGDMQNESHA